MVLDFDRWISAKAVAVVTGTSAGIGTAIAETLVKNGLTTVGIARRVERVEELAKKLSGEKGKLIPLKADVSNKDDVVKAFEWIKNNVGPVSILINNAGVTSMKGIIDGTYEDWRNVIDTNYMGLCVATKEAVNQMRENNINGHIIHINSITGHHVLNFPTIGPYAASKFAVTAITEALRNELREAGTKIKITSISPGGVSTEIGARRQADMTPEAKQRIEELFKNRLLPEDVADAVFYVLSTPERVQIHELIIKPVGEKF